MKTKKVITLYDDMGRPYTKYIFEEKKAGEAIKTGLSKLIEDIARHSKRKEALNAFADDVLLREVDKEEKAAKEAKKQAKEVK